VIEKQAVAPPIDYETVTVALEHGVAVVTLDRPERRNAYVPRMGYELNHAFTVLDSDDEVRAIVVTGAGAHFCVGADLSLGASTFERRLEQRQEAERGERLAYLPPSSMATPIIAAINGDAVGVGLTLPLQWDIRFVASTARLSFAFVRRGTIPEANSHWLLPRLVGASRALELLLTGRTFSGDEAASMGLASRSLPASDVLPTAMEVAKDIADNVAPVQAAIVKRLLNLQLGETDRRVAFRQEAALFKWAARQEDAKEGVRSFLERRPPDWPLSKNGDFPHDLFPSSPGAGGQRP
jgi:enoyl-CoA hydratase/carnithine racemase